MSAKLHIFPRITVTWETFQKEAPENSLALDGYVRGAPCFNQDSRHGNLNHHEEVDRLSTNCTASQAYMLLKQGLMKVWENPINLFVNDCDQDVCLATWLLSNPDRITGYSSEPLLNKILYFTNTLDVCAGAYPIKADCETMEQLVWIYEPYGVARMNGSIQKMDAAGMKTIIEAVHGRIDKALLGKCERKTADTRYQTLHAGATPVLLEEGNEARTKMLSEGLLQFISYRGEKEGRHHYSLVKLTPFAALKLPETYERLNQLENLEGTDIWGGADNCGGSPRNQGSSFGPKELFEILNEKA